MRIKRMLSAVVISGIALVGSSDGARAETDIQQFRVVNMNLDPGTVIAAGKLIYGAGVEQNTRLQVPPGTPFQVTFTFRDGQLFQRVTLDTPQVDFNPASCVSHIVQHPTTVVLGGSGAYAGASGTGTATVRRTVLGDRDDSGACLPPSAPPRFVLSIIDATTALTLP